MENPYRKGDIDWKRDGGGCGGLFFGALGLVAVLVGAVLGIW